MNAVNLSLVIGLLLGLALSERLSLQPERVRRGWIVGAVAGLLGARLAALLEPGPTGGGLNSWGFGLGFCLFAWLYSRWEAAPPSSPRMLDQMVPGLALTVAIGRIGCLLDGCFFGRVSDLPWAVSYGTGTAAYLHQAKAGLLGTFSAASLPVHPLALYESVASLLALAAYLTFRTRIGRILKPGEMFAFAILAYAGQKWLLRHYYGPIELEPSGEGLGLHHLGLAVVVVAALLIVAGRRVERLRALGDACRKSAEELAGCRDDRGRNFFSASFWVTLSGFCSGSKRSLMGLVALFSFVPATQSLAGSGPWTEGLLCQIRSQPGSDPWLDCRLEIGNFGVMEPSTGSLEDEKRTVRVVAFNILHGQRYEEILRFLQTDPDFGSADVLLLSEVDRGCRRSGGRHIARDLAFQLAMNYVYGVEFVELNQGLAPVAGGPNVHCEHGNAVLSRYPVLRYEQFRHTVVDSRYDKPSRSASSFPENRVGGRMAVVVDLDLWGTVLRVYAVHFASGPEDNRRRGRQALEVVQHSRTHSGPLIVGGDINSGFYLSDLLSGGKKEKAPLVFLEAGFVDVHRHLPLRQRPTSRPQRGLRLLLDVIFVRHVEVVESQVCEPSVCDQLSDHLPIQTTLRF